MLSIIRIILYICFQILIFISCQQVLSFVFQILSTISFTILIFKRPGNLSSNQIISEQKVQVFTPQGDKQFQFTDRANKTTAKILQSSLVIYKRKHLNSLKEDESIKEEKQIEIPQINKQEVPQKLQQSKQSQSQSVVYLESLYCISCLIDQILRSRHCKLCGVCILAYDHHNFIIGNCIGEKNKIFFVFALLFHSTQIILTSLYLNSKLFQNNYFYYACRFLLILLFSYLTFLLLYQTYLIVTNQTQAENRFRYKLNYMKYIKDDIDMPFNQGLKINLKQFFISSFQKQPFKWTFSQ